MPRKRLLWGTCLVLILGLAGGLGVQAGSTGGRPGVAPMAQPQAGWTITAVDAPKKFTTTSLALDGAGQPHIAYGQDHLYYRWYDGSTWQVETVDSTGSMGRYNALAVDSAGHPHIVYLDETGYLNARLRYAWHDGTAWQIQAATSNANVGFHVSLLLDGDDRPHVAYCDQFNYRCDGLHYDYYDGTSWQRKVVAGGSETGYFTSLALDPEGYPVISYLVNLSNASLRLARYNGSAWQIEIVQGGLGYSRDATLALDSQGQPHLSYHDSFLGDLMYAYQSCVAVRGASIDGPALLPAGQPGQYSASPWPPSATLPITFTWDNGSDGVTTTYSWDVTGTYTLTMTATNDCGWATGALTVNVFCQSLEGAEIAGPEMLVVNREGVYEAIPQPITASLPITFTWSNNTSGSTATYSWAMTGTYEIVVTATNPCAIERRAALQVRVLESWPYAVYVPLVLR